ncbi:ATP-dependent helicase [Rhodopirellula sp. SM50]|nr:DEAD/DEAH box helicase [Rhodopirellula sp. SM50]PAY16344.1 ATP-dependent helicase [Rhodopirellula sp. SM50]
MSGFDRLHPALQHHIVNSLGWRELRPFQEAVIPEILDGKHMIVLAPTAGGKTEACFFPVASRMLSENWSGLSVLYLCPIKALLNNLDVRLQHYCTLLGRRSALWHGDVKSSGRKRILREPPDCLLTTPESLEVMLDSPTIDARAFLANLQVVVVDEIHAFAGDDRGWHLLSVLERASKLAGRELQRVGLSATVGNPKTLVDWLAGSCTGTRDVYLPPPSVSNEADVKLDFVGSLENAATVISRLHRGEKRLVFVDSRARAERLAAELRQLQVTTFVTHSSLSQEQRYQAEEAFATREDCVIVATSVLELGIDVGNLERVIQVDSPPTVSSFLQRMGRTGRRAGTTRNCLFLATKEAALVQAAALIDLWADGFVEPIVPPPLPYHVLAQQLMALVLQESGIGRNEWFNWVEGVPGFQEMPGSRIEQLVDFMLDQRILWDESGILAMDQEGEATFGRRNFMELFSVFMSPPLFTILYGRQELGSVDQMTFLSKQDGPRILLLGGRAWQVNHIDWARKRAYVEPTEARGRTRWSGEGQGLGFALSQSIKRLLAGDATRDWWSRRASEYLGEIRHEYAWLHPESTVVVQSAGGECQWWTFGGSGANATLASELSIEIGKQVRHDSFALKFDHSLKLQDAENAIQAILERDASEMRPPVEESAIDGLKFSQCLPKQLAIEMLSRRLQDIEATTKLLGQSVRYVSMP